MSYFRGYGYRHDSDHRYRRHRGAYPIADVLYTTIGLPVYTLRVTNLLPKDDKKLIEKMFSAFGIVKELDIITEYRFDLLNKFSYAFVTFESPHSVAKAIRQRSSLRVKIKFADDWKQLECALNLQSEHSFNFNFRNLNTYQLVSHANLNILNLNDDCLYHIITFLSLPDKLNLSKVSPRFLYLCGRSFRILKELFKIDSKILRIAFINFGKNLRMIYNVENIWILHLLSIYCINLKVLSFRLFSGYTEYYIDKIKIISEFKNLENISFTDTLLNDDILFEMSNLPNLKILSLIGVRYIEGSHLNRFIHLTQLTLVDIPSLKSEYFISLLKIVKLEKLVLCYVNISNSVIDAIFEYQTDLELLSLDTFYNCDHLKNIITLLKLKMLCLHFKDKVNIDFLCDIYFNQFLYKDFKILCNQSFKKIFFRNINGKLRKFEIFTDTALNFDFIYGVKIFMLS